MSTSHDRTDIYYWKCDRAAAFHGTEAIRPDDPLLEPQLLHALEHRFSGVPLALRPANGQGNHRTFRLTLGPREAFVRTEDGPERDNYFAVESAVTQRLCELGIPVPQVLACDCSRTATPFAWQVIDYIPFPDLNQHFKQGTLDWPALAEAIGAAVARWQTIRPDGFGPFSAAEAQATGKLQGLHADYPAYYFLNLQRHLDFLTEQSFFTAEQAAAVLSTIQNHKCLLDIDHGCLVHKDLALWNILGSSQHIAAFIDWDDAVSGDPMDDLSLLACFYDAPVLERALTGYARVRPLPENHLPRFWLHLLRNMIVKAVIRVGAGYFSRNDSFFLIGAGRSGADLETFTRARIDAALRGLNEKLDLSIL
jgi:aminoglycoside phosphotransferase (APT) family kinase protein